MNECKVCGRPCFYTYCESCLEDVLCYEDLIGYILEFDLKKDFFVGWYTEFYEDCSQEHLEECENDWYKLYDRRPQEALDMMIEYVKADISHYMDWIERNDYL